MIFQMEAPIWESGVKMGRPRKSGRQGGVGQERSKVHLGFGELGGRAGCLFRSAHALLAAPLPFPALPRPPCASISWHPRALPFATHVAPAPRPTCVPPRFSPPSSTRSPLPTIPSLPPRCLFLHLLLLVLLLLRHLHPRPALSAHHVSRSLLQPLKPRSRRQSLHRLWWEAGGDAVEVAISGGAPGGGVRTAAVCTGDRPLLGWYECGCWAIVELAAVTVAPQMVLARRDL